MVRKENTTHDTTTSTTTIAKGIVRFPRMVRSFYRRPSRRDRPSRVDGGSRVAEVFIERRPRGRTHVIVWPCTFIYYKPSHVLISQSYMESYMESYMGLPCSPPSSLASTEDHTSMRTLSMYEPRGPQHWGGGGFMSRSPPSHPKMRDHQVESGRLLAAAAADWATAAAAPRAAASGNILSAARRWLVEWNRQVSEDWW